MNSVKFVDTKFCGLRENVACQESRRSCVTCVRGINFVCSYDFFMIFCSGDKMSLYCCHFCRRLWSSELKYKVPKKSYPAVVLFLSTNNGDQINFSVI